MNFDPIAIVGRGCVFPEALSPSDLWSLVVGKRDAVSAYPESRWRIPKERVLGDGPDRSWTDRGGYVRGFAHVFDPTGFAIPVAAIQAHDEGFRWMLHAGREALREAGIGDGEVSKRTGAIVGHLGLPSENMARYAEEIWSGVPPTVRPENRFVSGLPVQILARALGLDIETFALDAACASSLYAIKLACDELRDGRADMMLAGGLNRADDLFLHIGFTALQAISRMGMSRPFHTGADGLLPAEGAAFVALKRLADAEAHGNRILAVIRGIGLSNDGRTAGLLTPSASGQEQAMRQAYVCAGIEPAMISLLECHATGTPIGDACEIRSASRVFEGTRDVPIGSVKSNLGHPITAAGMAGLLKLIGAIEQRTRPATLHVSRPAEALDVLADSPFRLLLDNEPWEAKDVRRAALSAFGFGGNNAHLIVEEYAGSLRRASPTAAPAARVAVVGIGVSAGGATGVDEFTRAVFRGEPEQRKTDTIALDMGYLGFPPADLAAALPQQVLALQAASEAIDSVAGLDPFCTGLFVGMACDAETARFGLRWRTLARGEFSAEDIDAICPPLTAAGVIGRLGNIVANRIGNKYDLRGPCFAVMAEELSGIVALRLAIRALAAGELDAAVVGAVDLSCEPVHETAVDAVFTGERNIAGDAAVFLLLKRSADAGDEAKAFIEPAAAEAAVRDFDVSAVFGRPHAASALLDTTCAVLACTHGALIPARPWIAPQGRYAGSNGFNLAGTRQTRPLPTESAPRIFVYSGENRRDLMDALRSGTCRSPNANANLAIVAATDDELAEKCGRALQTLAAGTPAFSLDGVYFREAPVQGGLAFVFPGAAAAYPGMGRTLLLAFPELLDSLSDSSPKLTSAASWIFDPQREPGTSDKLWGSSLLSQAHAGFTLRLLGIQPDAAIGISSGETNSLAAFGVWRDLDVFHDEFTRAGLLEHALGGDFAVTQGVRWQVWQMSATRAEIDILLGAWPALRLTGIYAPDEYSIAGPEEICMRALGGAGVRAQRLDYDLVVHCEEFRPCADAWRALHDRESFASPVYFYSHASGGRYVPHRSAIADALTQQALAPIDFPGLIRQAWSDGIRVFLEQGPQGACSSRIRRILVNREHAAIPMDLPGIDSLRQAANATAQLIVAGVRGAAGEIFERFRAPARTAPRKLLHLRAHAEPIRLPEKRPPQDSLFGHYARALAESHTGFLESCGAGPHEAFLETSQRAFLRLAGRLLETPAVPSVHSSVCRLTRRELEALASGPISAVLGREFEPLGAFPRVVRLPAPPLLLADRVMSIEGRALSMQAGSITTETDVRADAWYMYRGRMAPGMMIEAGQADLLLISWLGIDLEVRGERVYRLLGCDLSYHGSLPQAGETLRYEIHVDRHARQGDVRLFFFHYDCHSKDQPRLSVRNGQAGFFTDEELEKSAGIIGTPERSVRTPCFYSPQQVAAAAAGRAWECFGEGFESAAAHQRSPGFASPGMLLLNTVTHLTQHSGEAGPGYLRAELPIHPDLWFFEGHFKGDPCMPGTLMFEGCLQAMAFYMMAMGLTLQHDAWRFEPLPDVTYSLRCRGQVTPRSRLLVYELFVEQVSNAPQPLISADLLCTVDGLKAFHCRRMGLRLAPGYPLDEEPAAVRAGTAAVASVNGVALDYPALLACAWGSPVDAFGPPFARFIPTRLPRLPGPPYHFLTRITRIDGDFGVARGGSRVVAEYDVDPEAWFFECAGSEAMPLAVLMEIALQPCGWLACYSGIPLRAAESLYFRNLDGSAVIHCPVDRIQGVVVTETTLTNVAHSGGITLTSFEVNCRWNGLPLLRMQTTFGFFGAEDLSRQAGLPPSADDAAGSPADAFIDLTGQTGPYFEGPLRMPSGDLLMLDRITALRGPADGPGRIRTEKTIRPSDWFFKAHFFQDPVQPGSLGLDALLQAVQFYIIHFRLAQGIPEPAFEIDPPLAWKYRGQVLPAARGIELEVKLKQIERSGAGLRVRAEGWLSADKVRIYHFSDFGLRVISRAEA